MVLLEHWVVPGLGELGVQTDVLGVRIWDGVAVSLLSFDLALVLGFCRNVAV